MTILLVIHGIITALLIGVILIQRNSGDGLAIGGGGGGNSFMTGRGVANFMTRTTAILATLFICSSLGLAIYMARSNNISMADKLAAAAEQNSKPPVAAGTKPVVVDKNAAPLPSAPKPEDGGVVTPAVTPQAPAPVAPEAVTPVETPAAPAVSPEVPKPE